MWLAATILDSLENQLVNFAGWDVRREGKPRMSHRGDQGRIEAEGAQQGPDD